MEERGATARVEDEAGLEIGGGIGARVEKEQEQGLQADLVARKHWNSKKDNRSMLEGVARCIIGLLPHNTTPQIKKGVMGTWEHGKQNTPKCH